MSDNNSLGLSIEFGNQEQFAGTLSDLERLLNSIEKRIGGTVEAFSLLEGRLRALSGAFSGTSGAKSFVSTLNDINNALKSGNFEKTADRLTALVTPAKSASKAVKDIATALDTGGIQVAGSNFATTLNSIVTTLSAANLPVVARQLTGAAANLPAVLSAVKKVSKTLVEFSALNIDALPLAFEKIFAALQIAGTASIQSETANLSRSLNDLSATMKAFFDRLKEIANGLDTKVADRIIKISDALKGLRRLSFDKAVEGIRLGAQQLADAVYQLNFVNFGQLETKSFQVRQFINGLAEVKVTGFLKTINALSKGFEGFNHFLEGLQSLPSRTVEVENTLVQFVENIKRIDLTDFSKTFRTAGLEDIASKLRNFSATVQASSAKLDTLGVGFKSFQENLGLIANSNVAAAVSVFQEVSTSIGQISASGNIKGTPPFVTILAQLSKALKGLGEIDASGLEKLKTTFATLREITIQSSELSNSKSLGLSVFNRIASEISARLVGGGADPFRILAQRVQALADVARGIQALASFPKIDVTNIVPAIESILAVAERINQKAVFVGILPRIFLTFVSAFTKNIPLISKALDLSSLEDISQRVLVLQRLILSIQRVGSLPAVNLDQLRNTVQQLVGIIHEIERAFAGNVLTSIFERVSRGFINLTAGGNVFERTASTIKALTDSVSALKGLQKLDVGEIDSVLRTLSAALSKIGSFFRSIREISPQSVQAFSGMSAAIKGFGESIEKASNLAGRFADAITIIRRELPKATRELARGLESGGIEKTFGEEGKQMAQATLTGIRQTWEIASPSRAMIRMATQLFDGLKVVVNNYPFAILSVAAATGFINPLIAGLVAGAALILPRLSAAFNRLATGLSTKLREVGGRLREEGKRLAQEGFQELATGGIFAFLQKQQVSLAADFDATVNQIRIFGDLTGDTLKKVEDELLRFSAVTIFNPQQTADAFLALQKSGLATADALKTLTSVGDLATAGQLDLAAASNLTVTAMTLFGLKSDQASHIADVFVRVANKSVASVSDLAAGLGNVGAIANQFGLSLDQTVAVLGIFNDNGIKGAEAGTQLKSVLNGITKPTAEVEKTFKQLNVSLTDARGNFRNFNDILSDLSTAMSSTRTVTTQVSGLTADQTQHLELLKKAYANATKQIQLYNVAAETGATPANKAADAVKRYQGIQANAAKAIAELTKSQATGAKITSEITRSQAQNFQAIQALAGSFGGSGLAVLIGAGDDALNQYIEEFNKLPGATKIADEAMKTFKGTFESFRGSVETLVIKALRPLLNEVVAPLLQGLTLLVNQIAELPTPILKAASGVAILVSGLTTVSGITKLLVGSFKTISGTLLQLSASGVQAGAAVTAPGGLVAGIGTLVSTFVAAIPIIAAFGAALYVGYNAFVAIQRDFNNNTGGLRDAIVGLFGAIRSSFESVVSIFRDGIDIIGSVLGDIGKQIQEAFSSQLIRDAARTAQNLFSGIAQTLDTIAKTIAFVKQGLQAISAIPAPETPAGEPVTPAPTVQGTGEAKIVKGDTYTALAKKYGTTVAELKKLNNNTRLLADVTVLKVPMEIEAPKPEKFAATVKDLTVSAADAALIDEGKVNLGLARRIGVQLSSQIDPLEQLFRRISTTDFFKSIFGDTDLSGALNTLKQFRSAIEGIGNSISNLVNAFTTGGLRAVLAEVGKFLANLIPQGFEINLGGIRDVFVGLVEGFERITGIGNGVSSFFKNLLKGLGVLKVDLKPITKGISDFFDSIRRFDVGKFLGDTLSSIRTAFGRLGNFLKRAADNLLVTIFDVINGKTDLGSLIGNLFDGFVNFAKSIDLGKIAANAKQFITDVINQIVAAVKNSPIGKAIGDAFAALSKIDLGKILADLFGGGDTDKSGKKVNGLASLVNNAVADLTPGFSALKTFIDTYVTPVANGIASGFSLLINTLTNNLTPEQSKGIADFVLGLQTTFSDITTKLKPVLDGINTVIVKPIQDFGDGVKGFFDNLKNIDKGDLEGVVSLVLKIGGAISAFVGSVAIGVIGGIIDGIGKFLPRAGDAISGFIKSLNSLDKGDLSDFLKKFGDSVVQFGAAVLEIPVSIVDKVVQFFQTLLGLEPTGVRKALEDIGQGIADFVRGAIRQFDNLQRSFRKTIVGFRLVAAIISGDIKAQAELLAEDTAFAISDKFGKVFGDLNAGKINLSTALASLKVNINGTVVDLTKADPAQIAAALGIEQKEGLIGAVKQAISLSDTKALKFLLPIIAQPEFKGVEGVSATIAAAAKAALDLFRTEGETEQLNLVLPALINLEPKDLSETDRAAFKKIIEDKLAAAIASGDIAAISMLLPLAPKFGVATDPVVLKKQVTDAIIAAIASGDTKALAIALQLAPQFGVDPKTALPQLQAALQALFRNKDAKGLEAIIPLAAQFGLSKEDIAKEYKDFLATAKEAVTTATGAGKTGIGETAVPVTPSTDLLKILGLDPDKAIADIKNDKSGLNLLVPTLQNKLIELFKPKEGENVVNANPLEFIDLDAKDTDVDLFVQKLVDSGVPEKVALGIRNAIRDAIVKKRAAGGDVNLADASSISILDVVDFSGLKADIDVLPAETRQKLAAFGLGVANDVFAGLAGADDTVVAQKATTIADTFMTAINEALGIKSPSTVMYDVGSFLIEGLNLGLTENAPTVTGFLLGLETAFYQLQGVAIAASDAIYASILSMTIGSQPAFSVGVAQISAYESAWLNLEIILIRIDNLVRSIAAVTGIFSKAFGVTIPAVPPPPAKKAAGGSVQADKLYEVADGRYGSPELLRANGKSFLIPGRNGLIVPPSPASVSNYGGNSSASMTQSINIQISGAGDPIAVGAAVRNELAQINRENPISRRLGLAGRK